MSEAAGGDPLLAVVHYPRLELPEVDAFRREHDPFASLIDEHVTLLFPVPADEREVLEHARAVAGDVPPFDLHVTGVRKTWDHWLYLAMDEGRGRIVELHERLYSGPMAAFRRHDLPFEPHIAIGYFGRGPYDPLDPTPVELEERAFERARARVEGLGVDEWRRVEALTVVRLDRAAGTLEDVEEMPLAWPTG